MSRDLWQVRRGVVQTKKMRKYLEIPAFTYNCWYPRRALKSVINPTGYLYQAFTETFYKDAFTIELWAYVDYLNESGDELLIALTDPPATICAYITVESGYVVAGITQGITVTSISSNRTIPVRQWFHVAATYDGLKLRLYINGELNKESGIVAAPINFAGFTYVNIYSSIIGTQRYYGSLDEIRIFNSAKSAFDVKFFMDKHYYPGDTGLQHYFNMDDATDDGASIIIPNDGIIGNQISGVSGTTASLITDNTPPIVLGSSFVVAEFATSLGRKCSLKYPVAIPDDAENFGLFVSWVDDSGDLQRKKLFGPDGIKLAPSPADYAGERMSDGFKFEIINVDGEDHVTLGSTLTLEISHTSNPTSGTDHAQLEAQDLTADTTLAEDYPLGGGSLTFNTQQTY